MTTPAVAHILSTSIHHRVRTSMVRDDMIGLVDSGRKQLLRPGESQRYKTGDFFLIARGTQWDMVNDTAPQGRYVARVILLSATVTALFHERFAEFGVRTPMQSCARIAQDSALGEVFGRTFASLQNVQNSSTLNAHRVLELLLILAEGGVVFSRPSDLDWSERVRRMVAQRLHAAWTVDDLAASFHLSASTLRRRLDAEGCTLGDCVREVRLESALLLLQSTTLSVSEIAYRCGYASHSRFSAAFRERFGFTPSYLRSPLKPGAQQLAHLG